MVGVAENFIIDRYKLNECYREDNKETRGYMQMDVHSQYEEEYQLYLAGATEATKLQDESCIFESYERKIKNQQQELRKMNKEREHLLKVIHKKNLQGMRLVRRRKELLEMVEKMKCCENCKHHHFMGDELKCSLDYDTEFECLKTKQSWELAE